MNQLLGTLLLRLLASICGATAAPSVPDTIEEDDPLDTDNVS